MNPADVLRAVAAYGLAGTASTFPDRALASHDWQTLFGAARGERLTGLLALAVVDGALPATEEQFDEALGAHVDAMSLALLLERRLLAVVATLEQAGVEPRVLKGPSTAHLDYPDPALRCFGDVDLLVRRDQVDRACSALLDAGYERPAHELRPGFDRRFGKGATFLTPDGYEIDLHCTFVAGPFGLSVELSDLWRSKSSLPLADRSVDTLPPVPRFLAACFNAALGSTPPRLTSLRDVVQLALEGDLDTREVLEMAARWRGQVVAAVAIAEAWRVLEVGDAIALSAWASGYRKTAWEANALSVYVNANATYGMKSLAAVGSVPHLRDKLAFLHSLAVPSREYLEAQGESHASWLRRGLSGARAARARE